MEKERELIKDTPTSSPPPKTSSLRRTYHPSFIDSSLISVSSGAGADGTVSFRREKYVPKGGPDGGNGGDGGSVFIQANSSKSTLIDFKYKRYFRAESGKRGGGSRAAGRSGEDLVIQVPVGTVVIDEETGEVLDDLVYDDARVLVARGGAGGKGNARFKSSVRQAPLIFQEGRPGTDRKLRLELKLLADVGLIGAPNAGKSTLLRAISRATPKVASYPFTTLIPNLAAVSQGGLGKPIIVADIPGLIEGAHEGKGLGIDFLKHVERTSILVHLVDASSDDEDDLTQVREETLSELESFQPELLKKPRFSVLSKMDLVPEENREDLVKSLSQRWKTSVFQISSVTGEGIDSLLSNCHRLCE